MKIKSLIIVFVIGLFVVSTAQIPDTGDKQRPVRKVITTNLAAGKFYKVSRAPLDEYSDQWSVSGYSTGVKLTDDSLAMSLDKGTCLGWSGKFVEVIVDLGSIRKIHQLRVHSLSDKGKGVEYPRSYDVQTSVDKKTWRSVQDHGGFTEQWSVLDFEPVETRYVKVRFQPAEAASSKFVVDELQVMGRFVNTWKYTPINSCYHGAFAPMYAFNALERKGRKGAMALDIFEEMVGKRTSMVLWYQGMQPARYFDEMQAIREQYTTQNFDGYRHFMFGWLPNKMKCKQIAAGELDLLFKDYFSEVTKSKIAQCGPIWFRPMNEMTGGWVYWGLDPNNFVKAWRRMYNIAEQLGATQDNVFVWSTNHASYPDKRWNDMQNYYPGDQYVDWVGISCYPPAINPPRFTEKNRYPLERIKEFYNLYNYKPLMIAEGGYSDVCDRKRWVQEWFEGVKEHYPMIRALIWENHETRCLQNDPQALELYRKLVQDSYWLDKLPTEYEPN